MKYITSFREDNLYLSNFYICPVTVSISGKQYTFSNSEAAFQAFKCPERAEEFVSMTPYQAKKAGKRVPLRNGWDEIRIPIMLGVVRAKFQQNPDIMEKLVNEPAFFVEGNTWGDRFWGRCKGSGDNWLGRILVTVRDDERERRGLERFYKEK